MSHFYRLIQGDCLKVLPRINAKSVDCIIGDFPYNIGKTEWDNKQYYEYWVLKVVKELQRVLKDNGVFWMFHISFPSLAIINTWIEEKTSFIFKQFITINKGLQSIVGRTSSSLRSFPRATEYLIFYTFTDHTGAEQLSNTYTRVNPMAKYLKTEFKRSRTTNKEIAKLFPSRTGGLTGCVSNWILGLNFPLKEQYETMRNYLNSKNQGEYLKRGYEYLKREYENLKREYENLKREYENSRYVFNLERGITDVWNISFYDEFISEHPTAKPSFLIQRIVRSTTNENAVILDPFLGSGTTMKVAQDLKRSCIGIEINPDYCEVVKKRCFGRQFLDHEVEYSFEVVD